MLSKEELKFLKTAWKNPYRWHRVKENTLFRRFKNLLDIIAQPDDTKPYNVEQTSVEVPENEKEPEFEEEDSIEYVKVNEEVCPICREEFADDVYIHACDSCGKFFHRDCIIKWIVEEEHKLCPYCSGNPGYIG